MAKYVRILSIDGGGIKGIIPAQVLIALEDKLKEKTGKKEVHLSDFFDIIAGTSTGGIIAGSLLIPNKDNTPQYTAHDISNLYLERGPDIFHIPFLHRIKSLGGLIDEKFPATGIKKVLSEYFKDKKLSDLIKPSLITAYEFEKQRPFYFTQIEAKKNDKRNFYIRDVFKSTSAAPTYFEASQIENINKTEELAFVDGGVFANNPSMCAYVEVYKKFKADNDKPATAEDMVIFSLGTGYQKEKGYKYKQVKNWGLVRWIRPVISMLMESNSETVEYQLRNIFDTINAKRSKNKKLQQYFRINPDLSNEPPSTMELDNVSPENLKKLQNIGKKAAEENKSVLDTVVDLLLAEEKKEVWKVSI